MASKEEKYKIITELFQDIFKVTQNDSVTKASTSEIKAAVGDGKWIIKVPGLCKILIRMDEDGMEATQSTEEAKDVPIPLGGDNAPQTDSFREPRVVGDKFINDMAREYE